MIDALIAGRIYGKPQARTAKNGSAFAVAKIRVGTRDGDALFVSVISFSGSAVQVLLALEDGDSIALAGELTPKVYTDRDGNARPALDLLAHAALSPYAVSRKREKLKKPNSGERDNAPEPAESEPEAPVADQQSAQVEAELDDEIPF